jgi:hypothetical protein
MSREAMQIALEALESDPISHAGIVSRKQAITALRQALVDADDTSQKRVDEMVKTEHDRAVELGQAYERGWNAALVQREWVGLTDEEIQDLSYLSQKIDASNSPWFDCLGFYRAIEAKLKEKNHG